MMYVIHERGVNMMCEIAENAKELILYFMEQYATSEDDIDALNYAIKAIEIYDGLDIIENVAI